MYINLSMDTIYKSVKNICKTTLRDEMYNFEEKEEFPLRRPLMEPWGPTPEGPPHLPSATLAKILTPSSRSRRTSYLTCLPLELHCPWDYPPPPFLYHPLDLYHAFCSWTPTLQTGRRGACSSTSFKRTKGNNTNNKTHQRPPFLCEHVS